MAEADHFATECDHTNRMYNLAKKTNIRTDC